MTVTFDVTSTVGQIRLLCADDQPDPDGILPEGKNISDEQLLVMFANEGNSAGRAAAAALEYAQTRWSVVPIFERMGNVSVARNEMIARLARRAADLRRQYGQQNRTAPRSGHGTVSINA